MLSVTLPEGPWRNWSSSPCCCSSSERSRSEEPFHDEICRPFTKPSLHNWKETSTNLSFEVDKSIFCIQNRMTFNSTYMFSCRRKGSFCLFGFTAWQSCLKSSKLSLKIPWLKSKGAQGRLHAWVWTMCPLPFCLSQNNPCIIMLTLALLILQWNIV
jgi:hypothetical protein